jgi:hypothetical protein
MIRTALLGAAGVLALSLTANAAGTTSEGSSIKSSQPVTIQFAQKKEDPSAGSVGFKKDDPSAGSVGVKKKAKKKAKKK